MRVYRGIYAFGSAEKINQGDDYESNNNYGGHKTAPDESVDHVFGFYISRAPRTAPRVLLKHIAAVSTVFCAHAITTLLDQ